MMDKIWKDNVENCSTPVVQKVGYTIHWINLYPLNSPTGFPNTCTYLLDSDLTCE